MIGYGSAGVGEGGTIAPVGNVTTMVVRKSAGCQDTNSNSADFEAVVGHVPRNTSTALAPCLPPTGDLETSISDSPDPVEPNQNVVYHAVLMNTSPTVTAEDATFTITFSGTAFPGTIVSIDPAAGCSFTTPTVTCLVDEVFAMDQYAVDITVTPVVEGSITAATDASMTTENNTSNNTASQTTAVQESQADVTVSIDTPAGTVYTHATPITVTFDVANGPQEAALNTTLAATFSGTGFSQLLSTPTSGCSVTTTMLTCAFGTLAASGTTSADVVVEVSGAVGDIEILALVGADEPEVEANNTDTATISVAAGCNLASSTLIGTIPATVTTPATVTIKGVVTVDAQLPSPNGLNPAGFYLQDTGDGNPNTSDGIYVVMSAATRDVQVGDTLIVTGTTGENFGQTRITPASASDIIDCQTTGSVTPVVVTLPVTAVSDWEKYEGMLVTVEDASSGPLTVTEAYRLHYLGEYLVSSGGRLFSPTSIAEPGAPANAVAAQNALRQLVIDDGRDGNINTNCQVPNMKCPDPGQPFANPVPAFRMGSTTESLTGVLGYGFSNYRLHTTVDATFNNVRPTSAPSVGGTLTVASFNVLNFFNGNGSGGGFTTSEQRGPNTQIEYDRMVAKLVIALDGLDADIIGLMEIENDGDEGALSAISDLTDALNTYVGSTEYAYVNTGKIGTDAIAVALLYRISAVTPVGTTAIDTNAINSRPTLAKTFTEIATGEDITVAVNHFKSKGSCPGSGAETDQGDGQGCWNPTRIQQAQRLIDWLDSDPTATGNTNILIIGDLNSYAKEDPIDAILAEGYTNLALQFGGEFAYGYVFGAGSGYLDHALSSPSLTPLVTGTAHWHINADEPAGRDYNDQVVTSGGNDDFYQPGELYEVNEFRTSDHDPVLIGISLAGITGTTGSIESTATVASGGNVTVTVTDADLSGASITVTATATGESETLTLNQASAGVYSGTFTVVNTAPTSGNSILEVPSGVITFTYVDALDADGDVDTNLTDTTTVTGIGATGTVTTPATIIPGEDNYTVTVNDADLSGASITVTLTSTEGESETLTLNEVVSTPGEYSATFDTAAAAPVAGNGIVEAQSGATLTVTYTDALNGTGATNTAVTANTTVAATATPLAFTLISPIDSVLREAPNVEFIWQDAGAGITYRVIVWHLSNNTRLGTVIDAVYEADDVCDDLVCSVVSSVALDQGTFGWTVVANGVTEVEASNAVGLFTVQYDGIELVSNGGFENGITGWTNKINAKVKCGGAGAGSDCALNIKPAGSIAQVGYMAGILAATETAAGDVLRVSAQMWANKPSWPGAIVVKVTYATPTAGLAGNGKDKFKFPAAGLTTSFAEYSTQFVLADSIVSGSVKLTYKGTTGKARFDDVSVLLMPVGTTPRITTERGIAVDGVLPPPAAPEGFKGSN